MQHFLLDSSHWSEPVVWHSLLHPLFENSTTLEPFDIFKKPEANDLIFAVSEGKVPGIKASALTANPAVITCLANDLGYEHIFSEQLLVAANKGDILVALSGSGNSPNIVNALKQAGKMQMYSAAILGFSGGCCKPLADLPIHLEINDMQMVEDIQIIIGHMIMKWLRTRISLIS